MNQVVDLKLPAVSCMCLTYGRPHELEEAIESFLRQDYAGEKELIVLNDLAEQTLVYEHAEVRIINLKSRYPTIGEKRNKCAELANNDILFVWDDDDIYLPNRISHSVRRLQECVVPFYKPDKAYNWNNGRITAITANLYHSQSCFSKSLFGQIGGYPAMGSGEDREFEIKCIAAGVITSYTEELKNYFYLYRWQGAGDYHLSAFGEDDAQTKISGEKRVGIMVRHGIRQGKIPSGEIRLKPQWRQNYVRQKSRFDLKNRIQMILAKK